MKLPERLQRSLLRSPLPWLLLAVAWTWPAALHPVTAAPGSAHTDLWESLWTLWFVATKLAAGQLPIHVDGLLESTRVGSLWPADILGAVTMAPITLTAGPAVAWTVLVIGHMTLRGWLGAQIGALYAQETAASEAGAAGAGADGARAGAGAGAGAGAVTGAILALAPIALAGVHNGASEVLGDTWGIAVVWMGLRYAPGWRWTLLAGLVLGIAAWAHWYGGLVAFCIWGVMTLRRGLPGGARRAFVVAGIVGALIAAPGAYAAKTISTAKDNVVGIKDPRELTTLRRTIGPADPWALVRPAPFRSPDFSTISRYGEDYYHCPYLGWMGLALTAYGVVRGRRGWALWLLPIGIGLAIGPVLTAGGAPVILSGRRAVPLPYFLLEKLPPFNTLSLLWKLAWAAEIGVALSAARGLAALLKARESLTLPGAVVAGVVVGGVALEAGFVAPTRGLPRSVDASIPAPIQALQAEPDGTVMTWPLIGGLPTLYEQVAHHKMVAGTLNFPASKNAWKVTRAVPSGRESTLAIARQAGIRYVVLHLDATMIGDESGLQLSDWDHFPVLAEDSRVRVLRLW
jgi:hypothetical protein